MRAEADDVLYASLVLYTMQLQNRGDINLAMCPSHHPFMKPAQLEEEANKLLTEAITLLYNSK